jgi:hypothetical protein
LNGDVLNVLITGQQITLESELILNSCIYLVRNEERKSVFDRNINNKNELYLKIEFDKSNLFLNMALKKHESLKDYFMEDYHERVEKFKKKASDLESEEKASGLESEEKAFVSKGGKKIKKPNKKTRKLYVSIKPKTRKLYVSIKPKTRKLAKSSLKRYRYRYRYRYR